jgi:hypothetical protein
MSESINYGISGVQNITAQNIAVGANSRIEQTNWSDAFAQPLADLADAIDTFEGPTQTREALRSAHTEIAHQLQTPEPDKHGIIAKLASLIQLAGPATAIVQAAVTLTQVITTAL